MKITKILLSVLMCMVLLTSCTEKETTVNYGFVCSDNLFNFVEIKAIYKTNKGEEVSVDLTPAVMVTFGDEVSSGETSDSSITEPSDKLEWRQSKKYDDDVKANLTITFKKKEGIDYDSYKGQVLRIIKYAYLISTYSQKGINTIKQNNTIEINVAQDIPDLVNGNNLEQYIDKLVANPIVK